MNYNFTISGFSDEIDANIEKQFETLNALGIKYFEVGADMEEFIKGIQTISKTVDADLMQYANQSGIVKERFNVKVWNEWMKKIEKYED